MSNLLMEAKSSINSWIRGGLCLAAALLFLFSTSALSFADINPALFLVVVSKEAKPYILCEEGIIKAIRQGWKGRYKISTIYLDQDEEEELREEVEELRPTAAICIGTRAAFFMKEIGPSYPWVATFLLDKSIQRLNLKRLLAVSMDVPMEKRMETLCRIKSHIRAGLLSHEKQTAVKRPFRAGSCMGKDAYLVIAPYRASIEKALGNILKLAINSFFITPDPEIFNSQEAVTYTLLWGLRNKVAVCGLSSGYVKNGALFALEADVKDLGEQAAELALDYLAGKIKEKMVIEHPRKFVLSLNLKTARRLGIKVPESVLETARIVIR